jgi:hypothetical protein
VAAYISRFLFVCMLHCSEVVLLNSATYIHYIYIYVVYICCTFLRQSLLL